MTKVILVPAQAYQITAKHMVAGFDCTESIVTRTAPILSYMRGWLLGAVKSYCVKKGWSLTKVTP